MCFIWITHNWCHFRNHASNVVGLSWLPCQEEIQAGSQCPGTQVIAPPHHNPAQVAQCSDCSNMEEVRRKVESNTISLNESDPNTMWHNVCQTRLWHSQIELQAFEAFIEAHDEPLNVQNIDHARSQLTGVLDAVAARRREEEEAVEAARMVEALTP